MLIVMWLALVAPSIVAPSIVTVDRVVDGDTVIVRSGDRSGDQRLRVRLANADCPETTRNVVCRRKGPVACDAELPRGRVAAATARALLPEGSVVTLLTTRKRVRTFAQDRWRRILARVELSDGRDLGEALVAAGVCVRR